MSLPTPPPRIRRGQQDFFTGHRTEAARRKKVLGAVSIHDAHNLLHEAEESNALSNVPLGLRAAVTLVLLETARAHIEQAIVDLRGVASSIPSPPAKRRRPKKKGPVVRGVSAIP